MTSTTQDRPILKVEGLVKVFGGSKRHPGVRVLHGIDLEIGRGETLGLVGESGSGKSTTGRCIVRLTDPTDGSVLFDGVDLAGLRGERLRGHRRRIQMVFQDPASSLDSRMTILQSVVEPLHVHKIGAPGERVPPRRRGLVGLTGGCRAPLGRDRAATEGDPVRAGTGPAGSAGPSGALRDRPPARPAPHPRAMTRSAGTPPPFPTNGSYRYARLARLAPDRHGCGYITDTRGLREQRWPRA